MALVETLFSEYPDGAPADWTDYWSTGDFTATVESNAAGDTDFGTKWLKYETNANDRSALTWDDLGSMSDVSVIAKIRVGASVGTNGIRLFLRVGGADTTEDAYLCQVGANNFQLNKYTGGSSTSLDDKSLELLVNTEYWIKFQVIGTALKAKIWAVNAIEPHDWHLEDTDTDHASGYVGIGAYEINQDFYLDYFAADTTEVNLPSAFLDDLYFSTTKMPTTSSASCNFARAMGGYFTESGRKLKGAGIYCKTTHSDQVRIAVYSGGDLVTGPQGATLLKDFGLTSGTAVDQWIDITTTDDINIPINAPLWIVVKGDNAAGFYFAYETNSSICGDFQIARGRTAVEAIIGSDPDVAFAATFPAGTDTFSANWYAVRIILDQQSSGYTETEKLISITSTISGNDSLNVSETELLVNIISTLATIDFQDYIDSNLLVLLSTTVSRTDIQDYQDIELLISLIISASSTDDLTWEEREKLVEIISEVYGEYYLDSVESQTVNLTISVTENNDQDFYDLNLSASLTITASCFDSVPVAESYKQVDLVMSITGTDLLDAVEDVLVPMTLSIEGTSTIVFEPENLLISSTITISEIDLIQYLEDLELSILMTVAGIDGYLGRPRSTFELISRIKLYQLIGRTKTYYLTKE